MYIIAFSHIEIFTLSNELDILRHKLNAFVMIYVYPYFRQLSVYLSFGRSEDKSRPKSVK